MPQTRPFTIAERADALAKGSGLYRLTLTDAPRQPRLLRWSTLLILMLLPVSYGLTIWARDRPELHLQIAFLAPAAFILLACLSPLVRLFGPRLVATLEQSLDERERAIRARAGHVTGVVMTIVALAGCYYMGIGDAMGWWRPKATVDWVCLGLMLQAAATVMPVFFASWMQPRLASADDIA